MKLLEQVNVRTTFILTGETGAAFRELVKKYADAYPGRFLMFAGFDKTDVDAPDYGERLRRGLREDVAAGAAGLGELSDKGLGLVRVGDTPYFIDDARFDPLWDEAGRLGVPVFVHIAEPAAFYEPPDAKNDLRRSANWSLYGKGTPGFKAMLAKFESCAVAASEDSLRRGPLLQPDQRPRRDREAPASVTATWTSISPRACGSSRGSRSPRAASFSRTRTGSCSAPTTIPCFQCISPTCGRWRPRTNGSGRPMPSGGAAMAWACPTAS